ncbi:hypothetical protein DPMN_180218 [Dreissena polymorpha]|uniref:Uncharacterized protein n=1 Tax=Dreissena polymorpha TaxID=45954 RepID=A0A9D4IN24_DREPO|nr:hypothetical protein DPMN_180218 [Dreissena polymorpha]
MYQEAHKSLIEWKPINERLMSAIFNYVYAKLTTVVCYAPTEKSVKKEMRKKNWSWGQVGTLTKYRVHWRALVEALCAKRHKED